MINGNGVFSMERDGGWRAIAKIIKLNKIKGSFVCSTVFRIFVRPG